MVKLLTYFFTCFKDISCGHKQWIRRAVTTLLKSDIEEVCKQTNGEDWQNKEITIHLARISIVSFNDCIVRRELSDLMHDCLTKVFYVHIYIFLFINLTLKVSGNLKDWMLKVINQEREER